MDETLPRERLGRIEGDWFQRIAETTSAVLFIYTDDQILYANQAAESLTGYTVEELLTDHDIWHMVAPEDRRLVRDRVRSRLEGESVPSRYTYRIVHRDGSTRWVEMSATRIRYDGEPAGLATIVDITGYRQAERALQRQAAFEKLILNISKQFLSLSADRFDDGLASALRALGEFTGVDRLTFFLHDEATGAFSNTYAWLAAGIDVPVRRNPRFDPKRFPWGVAHLRTFEPLYIPRVADMPAEAAAEQEDFIALGVRSVVSVPVAHRGELLGFIGCESIREERAWTDESLTLLKILGEILANALVRRRAEEALSREKERAQVTLASIGDGVIRTNAAGRIDYLNPVAERLTGWTLDQAAGREAAEVYQVLSESTRLPRPDPVAMALVERRTVVQPGLSTLQGRGGHEFIVRDSAAPILDRSGAMIGAVLVFKDLTQVRGLEREMAYLASHDALTGLLNRLEFEIHLEAALEGAREHQANHVLLFLDLLQFKLVNDACGHVAGDELLCQVASLLRTAVGDTGVLARLGGDEFGILLGDAAPADARAVANEIHQAFREYRFAWGGQMFEVGCAIGLVPITVASDSVIQVLKAADAACALAGESGRNRIHEYIPDEVAMVERYGQVQWVHRVRRALAEDRFCLFHQRIVPMTGMARNGAVELHEILLRMIDEGGDLVAPAQFIPVAEQYHLGPSLDRWVIRQALRLMSRRTETALGEAQVSINLSGQSLTDETFLNYIVERIDASGVPPQRIFFEITETAAVANLARAVRFIGALKEKGCRFILDDFGSGLSSFAYLKDLPVDLLKIDGEFVRSMESDPIRREMVKSIHQIGRVMGLETIAEWVENETTYSILEAMQVHYAQGYYVHRPEPLVTPAAAGGDESA